MRPERRLWKWLADLLPAGHYSRIETGATCPGFLDVHYTVQRRSGTIELKAMDKAKKIPFPNEDKGLHLSQRIWIREELEHGGTVWIIAQSGPEIFVIPGEEYEKFNGASSDELRWMSKHILLPSIQAEEEIAVILKELLSGDEE